MATQKTVELLKKSALETTVNNTIKNLGWYPANGSFEEGGEITDRNQVLLLQNADGSNGAGYYSWNGELPKTVATGSTPSTTGGTGETGWVYRADGSGSDVDSLIDLLNAPFFDGRFYLNGGFYPDTTVGGGLWKVVSSEPHSNFNGGTVVTVAALEAWRDAAIASGGITKQNLIDNVDVFLNWSGTGTGAFVRVHSGYVTPYMFGAVADGAADDYLAMKGAGLSGLPVKYLFSSSSYRISQGIDLEGKALNVFGDGILQYTPDLNLMPVISLDSSIDDDAIFYNFDREGWRCEGIAMTSTASFTQNSTTRKINIDKNQSALKTSTANGQKFQSVSKLVIRGFENGIKFLGDTYNVGEFNLMKFSYVKHGIVYKTSGTSNHLNSFRDIHFANVQAGVLSCGYDRSTDTYDLDTLIGIRYMDFDSCVFEFAEYGAIGGSGFSGATPINFKSCWFEQIAEASWKFQDCDVSDEDCHFTGAATGVVTYSSRGASNRYNKTYLNKGIIDAVVARIAQIRDVAPTFYDCIPDYKSGGSVGNPGIATTLKAPDIQEVILASGANTTLPLLDGIHEFKYRVTASGETTRNGVQLFSVMRFDSISKIHEHNRDIATNDIAITSSGGSTVITNNTPYPIHGYIYSTGLND